MKRQSFEQRYQEYLTAVENFLAGQFADKPHWADLYESMRYSLLSGGKRLRPIMVLEFARIGGLGEKWADALPAACALEMVHTYSLIHDDLPCMDDDDLRRGKPTNHKVYGETMAVLAGDALQSAAYELILSAPKLSVEERADCALILAQASGQHGMVAGQVLDTLHNPKTAQELTEVHNLKTGAMIVAACTMGCAAAGAGKKLRTAAENYAGQIGLAFQIRDDMLDVIGSEETFGKPIGSDREEGKSTFVDVLGLEGCAGAIAACTTRARDAVDQLPDHEFLWYLADQLAKRDH